MDIKITKLLLTIQKQTIGGCNLKKSCVFRRKQTKEKSIGAEPINIYNAHKIERVFYFRFVLL